VKRAPRARLDGRQVAGELAGAKATLVAAMERRRHELVRLCADLIRIPSENPPGNTTAIAQFIAKWLRARGIRAAVHEPRRGMPNLVAQIGQGRPNLVLSGHLDEFPAGSGWTFPPFSGRVRDGKVMGRGAGDMKAGLAVSLLAAALVKEAGLRLRGSLTLAFAADEETGGVWGTQWLLANVKAVRGDACLIGESSGTWSIGIGEKGVLWLRVAAEGRSGHAAYAQGESAVQKVLAVVDEAGKLHGAKGALRSEVAAVVRGQRAAAERNWGPGTGRLADRVTVNVGAIAGGGQVNLIPARSEAAIDFRLPPGTSTASVVARMKRAVRGHGLSRTTLDVLNRCESYVTSPRARLVQVVRDNARAVLGIDALPVVRLGYTDGRFFRREGIPTVVYGPSVRHMGGPDESIDADELVDVAKVHVAAIADFLGAER
jgi:succinyl-diaminopimelate desuccinylase